MQERRDVGVNAVAPQCQVLFTGEKLLKGGSGAWLLSVVVSASFVVFHHCIPLVLCPRLLLRFLFSHSGVWVHHVGLCFVFSFPSSHSFSHFSLLTLAPRSFSPKPQELKVCCRSSLVFVFLSITFLLLFDLSPYFLSWFVSKLSWALDRRFIETANIKSRFITCGLAIGLNSITFWGVVGGCNNNTIFAKNKIACFFAPLSFVYSVM